MNNKLHVYQQRHVFKGDDHIGKYDVQTRSVRLHEAFGALKDEVKAYYMRAHGIVASVLVGDEQVKNAAPLQEFPPEIRALMTPHQGDKTPAVIEYARKHFPREEFDRRYQGRIPFDLPNESKTARGGTKQFLHVSEDAPAEIPTTPGKLNALGLPIGAPDNRKDLIEHLKDKGVDIAGNPKNKVLVKLYMESITPAPIPPAETEAPEVPTE